MFFVFNRPQYPKLKAGLGALDLWVALNTREDQTQKM